MDGLITPSDDFIKSMAGWRLTTASILYRIPDHPAFLQEYIWQQLDDVPRYPILRRFIDFWQRELDGKITHVKVAVAAPLDPGAFRAVREFRLQ